MKTLLIGLAMIVYGCRSDNKDGNSFTFKTTKGEDRLVSPSESRKGVVYVFLVPDCPFSQFYTMSVNQVYSFYKAKGYDFYGIVPGKLYSKAEIDSFKSAYSFIPEILIDENYKFSRSLDVSVVPQVVLTDKNGAVLYSGKIDDQAIRPGEKKYKATEFYLLNALKEYDSGKPVSIKKTEPVGCFIE